MTCTEKPVIVIIPGAWHVPAHYAHLALKLNSAGYTVDCIESSATCDEKDKATPTNTWKADISIIRNAITGHTRAGRDVVVVMHSFGGMAGSEAAYGLGRNDVESEAEGAVVKLIYMASFLVQENQGRADFENDEPWPMIANVDDPKNPKFFIPITPKHFFYHDVPDQMTQRALDNIGSFPMAHAMNKPARVAWRQIPTAYIVCQDDRAILQAAQDRMIDAVRAQGVDVEVARLKSGHSPFLSMPGETAKVIRGFLEK